MFARWGALVYRFRKFIVVFSILLAIASLSLASQTSGALSSGGWLDNNSESAAVQRRLDEGNEAFRRMVDQIGGMAKFDRRRAWFAAHRGRFAEALG